MNVPKIWGLTLFFAATALAIALMNEDFLSELSGKAKAKVAKRAADQKNDSAGAEQAPAAPVPPEEDNAPRVAKTEEELATEIDALCLYLNQQLENNQIAPSFSKIEMKFHEKRLLKAQLKELFGSCFKKNQEAPNRVELDIFSSDFAGEKAADLVQVQVSVFDRQSKNKIFETGIHFELSSKQKSAAAKESAHRTNDIEDSDEKPTRATASLVNPLDELQRSNSKADDDETDSNGEEVNAIDPNAGTQYEDSDNYDDNKF